MLDLFLLDKLNNKSDSYIDQINREPMTNLGYNFISNIRTTLPVEILSVIFTNYQQKEQQIPWYILRLDRDKLEFLEVTEHSKSNFVYNFADDSIYLNGNQSEQLVKTAFKKHLRNILIDIKKERASVYEEMI